jgi:hypothetical protein
MMEFCNPDAGEGNPGASEGDGRKVDILAKRDSRTSVGAIIAPEVAVTAHVVMHTILLHIRGRGAVYQNDSTVD